MYEICMLKLVELSCQNQSGVKVPLWPCYLTFDPKMYRYLFHPASMYEILKLYIENYSRYLVRTKVLRKVCCDLDLLTPKCISTFFVYSSCNPAYMYEIWMLYVEKTSQVIMSEPVLTKFRSDLVIWPFDTKMYRYLFHLHLCMKYESCTLKTTQVIVSEQKFWQSSIVTWPFDPKIYRYLPLSILHLCMKYERWKLRKLSCPNQSVDRERDKPNSYRAPA